MIIPTTRNWEANPLDFNRHFHRLKKCSLPGDLVRRRTMTKLSYIAIAFIVIASVLCILRLSHVDKINSVTLSSRVTMDNNNSTYSIIYSNSSISSESIKEEESIAKGTNFTRNDQDTVVVNNTSSSTRIHQRRFIFIPFPHNTLGSGTDMECKWETITPPPNNDNNDNITKFDSTQLSAFAEGVCIPPHINASIHVLSSNEARTCLQSKRIIISGDSYMKQLFIGLADILLGKKVHGDKEIIGAENRSHVVATTNYWLTRRYENTNFSFPMVDYTCEESCYGRYLAPFSKHCSTCINALTGNNNDTIAVVGAGVHPKASIDEIHKFLTLVKRTIFVPMPHLGDNKSRNYYNAVLPYVSPHQPEHPFLDVYQLTSSCTMANCSYDGGHRSRYVNRWKAQLLLNTLCKKI